MTSRNDTPDDELEDLKSHLKLVLFALEVETSSNAHVFYLGVATALDKLDFAIELLERDRVGGRQGRR